MVYTKDNINWSVVPRPGLLDYVNEDFTKYKSASECGYKDPDSDFLIGDSGYLLMKMDFIFMDIDKYRDSAIAFDNEGKYTAFPEGTSEYSSFWRKETNRRRFGLVRNCKLYKSDIPAYKAAKTKEERNKLLQPLHITGAHYNYLNYSRIMRTRNEEEARDYVTAGYVGTIPKIEAFPRFWDGDYWNFKADKLAQDNEKNIVKGKARRKGYSFKEANDSANIVNLVPKITVLHGAYDIDYLTAAGALTYMTKVNLDWYENNTFWARGYLSEPLDNLETGYKSAEGGNKGFGYRSKLLSEACARNESALVGKDAYKIKIEEAGKFTNLESVVDVTISTTESGGKASGTMSIFGTGGTAGANWAAFEKYFFNGSKINAIEFENIWSYNNRNKPCGFFHPQILNYEPFMDYNGNSDLEGAFIDDYVKKKNMESKLNAREYVIYIGQRANTPEEAFSQSETSMFTSPGLIAHYDYVKRNMDEIPFNDGLYLEEAGVYKFVGLAELKSRGIEVGPYVDHYPHRGNENVSSCIRKFFEPVRVNGIVPKNLYRITIDTVGIDKTKTEITHKHSLASITVKAIANKKYIHNDIIVARYIGRRDSLEEVDMIALSLAEVYNAGVLPETNRGDTVKNFIKWGKKSRLLTEPNVVWDTNIKKRESKTLGMNIGDSNKKLDGLVHLYEWVYKPRGVDENGAPLFNYHFIFDTRGLSELIQHNVTGNFDTISDWILQAYDSKRIEVTKNYRIGSGEQEDNNFKDGYTAISKDPFKRRFYT